MTETITSEQQKASTNFPQKFLQQKSSAKSYFSRLAKTKKFLSMFRSDSSLNRFNLQHGGEKGTGIDLSDRII
ncbi:putative lipase [Dirofilaria immitis]